MGCLLVLASACSGGGSDGVADFPSTHIVAPIDRIYKFDAEGSLPLVDQSELPVKPGVVTARWFTFGGWQIAVFDGLQIDDSISLCLGTSFFNPGTNQLEYVTASPTSDDACDGSSAGSFIPPAVGATGMRECDGLVSYVTGIPAEAQGTLFATVTAFPGDGTGLEVSGRVESTADLATEIAESLINCGPLPAVRTIATPTPDPTPPPTPAPASVGDVAFADRAPPPTATKPSECEPPETPEPQAVLSTGAAPYFVHHPSPVVDDAPTIIFLPGGSGRRGSAERVWDTIFADAPESSEFRVVIPYSFDADFIDEAARTIAIVNEVLWCFGGDPWQVHLAGTSNGGLAAFGLMTSQPEVFATLLGAPGAFPVQDPASVDPEAWAETLAGRAVFNGVGVHDQDWMPEVIATHNVLAAAGIESTYVELPGQGHALTSAFDESVFFEYWTSH
jgi:predicted esterase